MMLHGRRPRWMERNGAAMRIAAIAAVVAMGVCATALGAVYWRQEALLFEPTVLPPDHTFAIADTREVRVEVDGATLSALHLRLPNPKGVIFFLHGNGGNLASWFTNPAFYRSVNYDLFMIDYRGYGKSTGRVESEAQLRADVRRAWDWVAPHYAGKSNVIYGRSLGSALAGGLAAEVQPALTILVSPYCSMAELARLHYPLIPTWLLRYPLSTCRDVARVRSALLLLHGEQDLLIPITQSEQIQVRAPQAELVRIVGAGHNDVHRFDAYTESLIAHLRAL
ncbi:MAG: alpha/beta fold hydrolase [Rhodocyclaceae bacterium]|nr:alpha/beta fold hydrolase [Rhodocyclaceae bacterium]